MPGPMLDVVPLWGLFLLGTGIFILALEGGYRLGQWRHRLAADEKEAPVGAMVAAILGLLAFMLGFTFSLAATRFEARRQVVFEEANAIQTAYLRSSLLPEPEAKAAANGLREYIGLRIRSSDSEDAWRRVERSEELHRELWSQAKAAAAKDARSIPTGLFIQTLNEVIDLHSKRVLVGLRSRIPAVIWGVLYLLTVIGLTSVGYQSGLSATRRSPAMIVLVLAFAGVIALIADLDRGHQGLIRVSQQALIDAQSSMQPPASP